MTNTINNQSNSVIDEINGYAVCLLPINQTEWNDRECDYDCPKIYVACLAAYNHGYLHGIWLNAARDAEDIRDDIEYMLSWSPVRHLEYCEEWAIHDQENFGNYSVDEYEDIEQLSEIALDIKEHGEAYLAYLEYFDYEPSQEDFKDRYMGEWESVEDYVQDYYESTGIIDKIDNCLARYIDWSAIARDWEINGDITSVDSDSNSVFIFNNH